MRQLRNISLQPLRQHESEDLQLKQHYLQLNDGTMYSMDPVERRKINRLVKPLSSYVKAGACREVRDTIEKVSGRMILCT